MVVVRAPALRWAALAAVACASFGSAPPVDYIRIERLAGEAVGAAPPHDGSWAPPGGGCLSIAGPEMSGGAPERWVERLVAVAEHRGPNGVAEWGGGDDVAIGPTSAMWASADSADLAHSGRYCLTDSPNGPYGPLWDRSATIADTLDLAAAGEVSLTFWTHWLMGYHSGVDYGTVEVRRAGAPDWEVQRDYRYGGGTYGAFLDEAIDLSAYAGDPIQIRFRIRTSGGNHADGWFIDDVAVSADGETLFRDDFESGVDRWILDGDWGLIGAVTELIFNDRNQAPVAFTPGLDLLGAPCADVDPATGTVTALPVPLPTPTGRGVGYSWVVARRGASRDAVLVRHGPPIFVPE
jgi:hypothetical protein